MIVIADIVYIHVGCIREVIARVRSVAKVRAIPSGGYEVIWSIRKRIRDLFPFWFHTGIIKVRNYFVKAIFKTRGSTDVFEGRDLGEGVPGENVEYG